MARKGTASGFLSRPQIRALKQRIRRQRDADAAIELLADSIRKGHERLALQRFCVAFLLDGPRAQRFTVYCTRVAASLPPAELARIVDHATSKIAEMGIDISEGGRGCV